jgi:hypothetical protein
MVSLSAMTILPDMTVKISTETRSVLNEQQRKAFNKLVNNGPLSLRGRREPVNRVHRGLCPYLIEKQNTKRILLVSQSHEAVNTARRAHQKALFRLGTELDVVIQQQGRDRFPPKDGIQTRSQRRSVNY